MTRSSISAVLIYLHQCQQQPLHFCPAHYIEKCIWRLSRNDALMKFVDLSQERLTIIVQIDHTILLIMPLSINFIKICRRIYQLFLTTYLSFESIIISQGGKVKTPYSFILYFYSGVQDTHIIFCPKNIVTLVHIWMMR